MMWGNYDGGNWLWMASMMLLVCGGVIALVILVVRAVVTSRSAGDPAADTLRMRLAAGEINQEEFDTTKRILQG